jgi:hypothetical protein
MATIRATHVPSLIVVLFVPSLNSIAPINSLYSRVSSLELLFSMPAKLTVHRSRRVDLKQPAFPADHETVDLSCLNYPQMRDGVDSAVQQT